VLDSKRMILLLRLSCFCLFFGRAWQHLVWDAPYRSLFWDEALMTPIVESLLGQSWSEYATSSSANAWIDNFIHVLGLLYAFSAVLCLMPIRIVTRLKSLLLVNTISLFILALLYSKERDYQLGMGIEFAAQFCSPLLLYLAVRNQLASVPFQVLIKTAVIGTLVGHGLYAIGYYPVPGNFIDMTIMIMGVRQPVAMHFLFVFGVIDLLLSIGILWKKTEVLCLAYAGVWGFVTAMARPVAFFDRHDAWSTLNQWLPEFIMRMPHAVLPLVALVLLFPVKDQVRGLASPVDART